MKTGYLVLPFIGLLFGAIGAAVGSSFPEIGYAKYIGWGLAGLCVLLWISLDIRGFKQFFRRKGAKYGASSSVVAIMGVAVIVGLCVLTSRPRFNKTFDLTRDGLNTLSTQSTKMIENLNSKKLQPEIEAFFTEENIEQQFRDLVALYNAAGGNLEVKYIDPQQNPTVAMAKNITSGNTVIIKLNSQEKRITTFTEEKLTNAFAHVLKESAKKVYFTTGHGEGAIDGTEENSFKVVVEELKNNKYEVSALSLLDEAKVPDDSDLLVIGGPRYDFKAEEIRFIEDYLKRGGAALFMVDAMVPVAKLNGLIEKFGIRYSNDLLILSPEDPRSVLYGQNSAFISDFDDFHPLTKDFASQSNVHLIFSNTRSLEQVADNENNFKVELVGKSSEAIIKVRDVNSTNDLGEISNDRIEQGSFATVAVATGKAQAPATANNNKDATDTKTDVPKGAEGASGRESRIVVVGSASMGNNIGARFKEHIDMFMNAATFLMRDEDFISIKPKDPTKTNIDLASGSSQLLLLSLAFIYPFLFLGFGVYTWIDRRRS